MLSKQLVLFSILVGGLFVTAAPVDQTDARAVQEKRFYYINYELEKRSEQPEKRFYYINYELEKRSEQPEKRFYYNSYEAQKRNEQPAEKRFYYNNYDMEKRGDEAAVVEERLVDNVPESVAA